MSKIGKAFGAGGAKPSHREIFEGLHQRELDRQAAVKAKAATDKAAATAKAETTALGKFDRDRLAKEGRLRGGKKKKGLGGPGAGEGDEEENVIKRPGARTAKLLGS